MTGVQTCALPISTAGTDQTHQSADGGGLTRTVWANEAKELALTTGVVGKHAVYFEFLSDADGEIASFDRFTFT